MLKQARLQEKQPNKMRDRESVSKKRSTLRYEFVTDGTREPRIALV